MNKQAFSCMTRRTTLLSATLCALCLSACASLTGPSAESISRLPVLRYGETAPTGQDFVLLYPAGTPLPVHAKVVGTLLEKTGQADFAVVLKRDVYLYRDQASFDGKTWQPGHRLVGGRFWFSLPGDRDGQRDGHSPAELGAAFDQK